MLVLWVFIKVVKKDWKHKIKQNELPETKQDSEIPIGKERVFWAFCVIKEDRWPAVITQNYKDSKKCLNKIIEVAFGIFSFSMVRNILVIHVDLVGKELHAKNREEDPEEKKHNS